MQGLELVTFKSGDIIFEEENASKVAYVITNGEVDIFKTVNGKEVQLVTRTPGEVFGEMAFVDDSNRSASARAKVNTTCYRLTELFLDKELGKLHPFMQTIFKALVSNTRAMTAEQIKKIAKL